MAPRARSSVWSSVVFVILAFVTMFILGELLTQNYSLFCLRWGETDEPVCWRPQNLQLVAGLWIVGAIYGIVDTLRTFRETAEERMQAGNDAVLVSISSGNVRRELFRLLELIALLLIGCIAVTGVTATLPSRLLVLFVIVMLVTNAHLDRNERQHTERLIRNGGRHPS